MQLAVQRVTADHMLQGSLHKADLPTGAEFEEQCAPPLGTGPP